MRLEQCVGKNAVKKKPPSLAVSSYLLGLARYFCLRAPAFTQPPGGREPKVKKAGKENEAVHELSRELKVTITTPSSVWQENVSHAMLNGNAAAPSRRAAIRHGPRPSAAGRALFHHRHGDRDDFWQIERKNEINQEQVDTAIEQGHVARDPSTATNIPGDPGAITAVLASYVNSNSTRVNGVDLDARRSFTLGGGWGALAADVKWTHLFKWERTERDGTTRDFAGTHGNCDVTNCMGTPEDRVNLGLTWDRAPWRVAATVNYRGKFDNTLFKDDPDGCAVHFADGRDAPNGCRIGSFTTLDVTARWRLNPKLELTALVQNLFDKAPPLDPLTYGAASYNPLDYSGALGRFFKLGVRYQF